MRIASRAACLLVIGASLCLAQQAKKGPLTQGDLEPALGFEGAPVRDMPRDWDGGPPGTVFTDDRLVHGGQHSARLERNGGSSGSFSSIAKSIPLDISGKTVELRGFLRLENVTEFAGLWLREDAGDSPLAFDNMQSQHLNGSKEWSPYSVQLEIHPDARQLVFGVLLVGSGKVWADDLQLLVDGKNIWEAPPIEHPKVAIDLDHEFDQGSKITASAFSAIQVENLATLGKVWGFLKYHHPLITSGKRHWDYDLFRVMPAVLSAADRSSANNALLEWIDRLGPIEPCRSCAQLDDKDLSLVPDLKWMENEGELGRELSERLRSIWRNRLAKTQFYLSFDPEIGNPVFKYELGYNDVRPPDTGFQLLALFRFWNIMQYWSPYRDLIGEDWEGVLREFVPRVGLAHDENSYTRELLALIAKAHDGHANLWAALDSRPPVGKCYLPAGFRFVGDSPVITAVAADSAGTQLQVGDVVEKLDDISMPALVKQWTPYYATSNEAARLHAIAQFMGRGRCGDATVDLRRQGRELRVTVQRILPNINDLSPGKHDLPGPAFRLLSKDVAYLKLSAFKGSDTPHYLQQATGTKGLIIDIRNYPSDFAVFALGSHFVKRATDFARFTTGDPSNPGAFHWTKPESLKPTAPHYAGKVVVLADETSVSQSEYTTMAFRSAPNAIFVGSTTAGADGDVSPFLLPGGLKTMISGIGVFYPDKKPTQRIGIVPDVVVNPTIEGIRAGRDEVLEVAVRQILGKQVPAADIDRMIRVQAQ